MSVTVIIATYGDERWADLAWSRAYPSAMEQGCHVCVVHDAKGTLASVRNAGARATEDEWLCFLDADDELAPGYVAAMQLAWRENAAQGRERALLVPRVQYVRGQRRQAPHFPAFRAGADLDSLQDGNWLVIGTLIERDLFWEVGGWEDWPMYEDWALFARAWKAGAALVQVPDAVYVAHRRPRSRNHEGGRNAKLAAHDMIRRAVFPELYEAAAS